MHKSPELPYVHKLPQTDRVRRPQDLFPKCIGPGAVPAQVKPEKAAEEVQSMFHVACLSKTMDEFLYMWATNLFQSMVSHGTVE